MCLGVSNDKKQTAIVSTQTITQLKRIDLIFQLRISWLIRDSNDTASFAVCMLTIGSDIRK